MGFFRANENKYRYWNKYNVKKHNVVKNSNWQEADQLAIYQPGRGVELRTTKKQHQLMVMSMWPWDFKSNILTTWP